MCQETGDKSVVGIGTPNSENSYPNIINKTDEKPMGFENSIFQRKIDKVIAELQCFENTNTITNTKLKTYEKSI